VGQFPVYNVTHRTIWSSIYISVQEGYVAIWISCHGELDVGKYATEVVKEIIHSVFFSMKPDQKCIIHTTESVHMFVGCLAE